MAKRISKEKRALILALLVEGTAINAVARVTKTGKNQILQLIVDTGEACREWHNENTFGLSCKYVQADEIWSYVHTKQGNIRKDEPRLGAEKGDCWTFSAIDSETKFVIAWETGTREQGTADAMLSDMMERVDGDFQLSTDGYRPYKTAMAHLHEGRVSFGTEIKNYGLKRDQKASDFDGAKLLARKRQVIIGDPEWDKINTSHVERHNLTIRQQMKRFARRTLGYSKKFENHAAAVDMFMFFYNWSRKSESEAIKGKTPAMAAGLAAKPLSLERVVEITDKHMKAREEAEFEKAFALKFESL